MGIDSDFRKWKHDDAEGAEPGDIKGDGDARGFFFFLLLGDESAA